MCVNTAEELFYKTRSTSGSISTLMCVLILQRSSSTRQGAPVGVYLRKTGSDISTTLIQGFNFMNSRFQLHEFTNSTSRIHEFNFTNSRIQLHEFNFTNSRIQLHEFTNSTSRIHEFHFTNSTSGIQQLNS